MAQSVKGDKSQPFGNVHTLTASGAASMNAGSSETNLIGYYKVILDGGGLPDVSVAPRIYFGTVAPTAGDYPNADIGSIFLLFTLTDGAVSAASIYLKKNASTWQSLA